MPRKPKQWVLADQTDKFLIYHYEAPEGSNSALWVEVRWSLKRVLYTAFRSNTLGDSEAWIPFARSIRHHAVAKRQAFEAIALASVPQAPVHEAEGATE
jgi:hypothetical protein